MEYSRIAWKSDESRAIWESRLSRICSVWEAAERESVLDFRVACLQFIDNERLMGVLSWAKEHHLHHQIIDATHSQLRVALTKSDSFQYWWNRRNDPIIGELLGYPSCCADFFNKVWNHDKHFDTTLSMADARVCSSIESNILLRWSGIRLVPFLPCSSDCAAAVSLAKKYAHLVWKIDRQSYRWIREALAWPVRYSALHGAAIISTLPFEIIATTDYTDDEIIIERPGMRDSEWKDNGFGSLSMMDEAHDKLIDAFLEVDKNSPIQSVIDLGCGNAALLDKFLAIKPTIKVHGIDTNSMAIDRAEQRIPVGDFKVGDIYNIGLLPKQASVAFVSINRFIEAGPQKASWLLGYLSKICDSVVIYSYDHSNIDRLLLGLQLVATKKFVSGGGVAAYVKLPCTIVAQV